MNERYPAQRFFQSMLEYLTTQQRDDDVLSDEEVAEQQWRARETRRLVEQEQIDDNAD
jgi:hypothetical protein